MEYFVKINKNLIKNYSHFKFIQSGLFEQF
jgi:hypothetical protein